MPIYRQTAAFQKTGIQRTAVTGGILMAETESERSVLLERTSKIVAGYVANNSIASVDLPNVISRVYEKLGRLGKPQPEPERVPAVPIRKSLGSDFLVCLECGKRQKMLKRHLAMIHDLTPQDYRARWRLGYDYPMIAPNYAVMRSAIAKELGLGRKATRSSKPSASRRKKS
jgi:predicted transcriptional regulator